MIYFLVEVLFIFNGIFPLWCSGTINAPDQVAAEPEIAIEEEDLDNVAEVCDPSDNEGSVLEEETIESPVHKAAESTPAAEDDAPKTYAAIVSWF